MCFLMVMTASGVLSPDTKCFTSIHIGMALSTSCHTTYSTSCHMLLLPVYMTSLLSSMYIGILSCLLQQLFMHNLLGQLGLVMTCILPLIPIFCHLTLYTVLYVCSDVRIHICSIKCTHICKNVNLREYERYHSMESLMDWALPHPKTD